MNKASKAKVSIVIPVKNAEGDIAVCIESILRQSYSNFELILVDNLSADSTCGIMEKFARKDRRIRILTEPAQGRGSARRRGELSSSGEIILMTDADCVPGPDWIRDMCREINEKGVVAAQGLKYPLKNDYWSKKACSEENRNISEKFKQKKADFLDTANFAIKRKVLAAVGYTNPYIKSGNDTELGVRLKLENLPLSLAEVSVGHRYGKGAFNFFKRSLVRGLWNGRIRRAYLREMRLFSVSRSYDDLAFLFSVSRELLTAHPDFKYNFVTGTAWRLGLFIGRRTKPVALVETQRRPYEK